ncbi:unnamed protein product [Paramecium pentaurelia]|uniref:Uncharacterized protein n=1 Tax=Paramecium pentaurelia TaxID=43138 RepID=A0A8S1Y957_9CILI|nr:unnamed protein product [Paramecium pentaurelia]
MLILLFYVQKYTQLFIVIILKIIQKFLQILSDKQPARIHICLWDQNVIHKNQNLVQFIVSLLKHLLQLIITVILQTICSTNPIYKCEHPKLTIQFILKCTNLIKYYCYKQACSLFNNNIQCIKASYGQVFSKLCFVCANANVDIFFFGNCQELPKKSAQNQSAVGQGELISYLQHYKIGVLHPNMYLKELCYSKI